jgi:hypothetical protein
MAGGVPAADIARWDGATWSPLGSGIFGLVYALAVFDDGAGPALYAGGVILAAGGVPANGIARWDGASWSPLGSGFGILFGGSNPTVYALAVFDDGAGAALYAGGDFVTAGGAPAERVAKWDGTTWSGLGQGMNNWVRTLAVFDGGGGAELVAGGTFSSAGGMPVGSIAKWNGAHWSPLGIGVGGIFPGSGSVSALRVFDDGSGPALMVGGNFEGAGGALANNVAKWDGTSWSALDRGANGPVLSFAEFDDGSGAVLVAGGSFSSAGSGKGVAQWDGASWSGFGSGLNQDVRE